MPEYYGSRGPGVKGFPARRGTPRHSAGTLSAASFLACTSGAERRSGSGCLTLGDPDDRVGRPGSASTHEHVPGVRRRALTRGDARHGQVHGDQAREAQRELRRAAARVRGARDVRHRLERAADHGRRVAREVRDERGLLPRPADSAATRPASRTPRSSRPPAMSSTSTSRRATSPGRSARRRASTPSPASSTSPSSTAATTSCSTPRRATSPATSTRRSSRAWTRWPRPCTTSGAAAASANISRIAAWKAVADLQTRPVSGSHHRVPAHRVAARPAYRVHHGGGDGRVANAGCDRRIVGSDALHP